MRHIHCLFCSFSFNESDAIWDHAFETGACPHCGRFFDFEHEALVTAVAKQKDVVEKAKSINRKGLKWLIISLLIFPFHFLLSCLIYVRTRAGKLLFYTSEQEARTRLAKKTDLSRFSS